MSILEAAVGQNEPQTTNQRREKTRREKRAWLRRARKKRRRNTGEGERENFTSLGILGFASEREVEEEEDLGLGISSSRGMARGRKIEGFDLNENNTDKITKGGGGLLIH